MKIITNIGQKLPPTTRDPFAKTLPFNYLRYLPMPVHAYCQAAQKVQWDTTAMMIQLHHVFPI